MKKTDPYKNRTVSFKVGVGTNIHPLDHVAKLLVDYGYAGEDAHVVKDKDGDPFIAHTNSDKEKKLIGVDGFVYPDDGKGNPIYPGEGEEYEELEPCGGWQEALDCDNFMWIRSKSGEYFAVFS